MSGHARRLKKLESIDEDKRDGGYWFTRMLESLGGNEQAKANIEAIRAAGGSPGYRAFEAMIDEVFNRMRARGMDAELAEIDNAAEMGAA